MNKNLFLEQTNIVIRVKEVLHMDKCTCGSNSNIKCSVNQCKFNNESSGHCSLEEIKIGTHEANPTVPQCTDCESFVLK